jgi:alpha-D-ribose 1-methylphosphonate 5-triphosphate synthase subunit PhnH
VDGFVKIPAEQDLGKINRDNFTSFMNALARPGRIYRIAPAFSSMLMGCAGTFLYPEVTYFYSGREDFSKIEVITECPSGDAGECDYAFYDSFKDADLNLLRRGTYAEPDKSATAFILCEKFEGTQIRLTGPGIETFHILSLPVPPEFIQELNLINSDYPKGIDVFFADSAGNVAGWPRTAKAEIV